jgi:hypothetical protein
MTADPTNHDPFNHPRLRKLFPYHAIMLQAHPTLPDISAGHYFFYAQNLGGHVQVLHESFSNPILIRRRHCDLFPAKAAREELASPATVASAALAPTAPPPAADDESETKRRYIEEHNRTCHSPQPPTTPSPLTSATSTPTPPPPSAISPISVSPQGSAAPPPSPNTSASTAKPSAAGNMDAAHPLPASPSCSENSPTSAPI